MFGFDDQIDNVLNGITIAIPDQPQEVTAEYCAEKDFVTFKEFVISYAQEHDSLPDNHAVLDQLRNFNTVDELETVLRHNLDYCDDCVLKMFRKYAAGKEEPEDACPCGDEGEEPVVAVPDTPPGGG